MLRETLKHGIDMLDESQLWRIAEFISFIKDHTVAIERAQEFRAWIAGLPRTNVSLPDEAFDQGSIYGQNEFMA